MSSSSLDKFIITRKRKLYKFAAFKEMANCFDDDSWPIKKPELINDKGLTIEVGAGTALFLTKLARNNPDMNFLAIDRKSDRLYTGAKFSIKENINNISYLWTNARHISKLLGANTVDNLWITFPDPWPQESNIKHRLTNKIFMSDYHKILKPGHNLYFKTDNKALFDWTIENIDQRLWQIDEKSYNLHVDAVKNRNALIMTSYEERYHQEGKLINYVSLIAK